MTAAAVSVGMVVALVAGVALARRTAHRPTVVQLAAAVVPWLVLVAVVRTTTGVGVLTAVGL